VSQAALRLEDVYLRYPAGEGGVLRGLSFDVGAGEIVALLGPSGSGKTTTLRAIAGFESISSGRVSVRGTIVANAATHVAPDRRGLGFVFQEQALFPHLDVANNVAFGLRGRDRDERMEIVRYELAHVGLGGYEHRWPQELSGGERQRVALARALAPRPGVLLMDEPFSSLDAGLRESIRRRLRERLKSAGTTVLMVTHDQEEALTFADRVAVLHEGRVAQIGDASEMYGRPRSAFVAQFLGATNLFDGEASGEEASTVLGPVRLDREANGHVRLALRPEHIELTRPVDDGEVGKVLTREFKGHDVTLRVRWANSVWIVQADYRCDFQEGEPVRLVPREPAVVLATETR